MLNKWIEQDKLKKHPMFVSNEYWMLFSLCNGNNFGKQSRMNDQPLPKKLITFGFPGDLIVLPDVQH